MEKTATRVLLEIALLLALAAATYVFWGGMTWMPFVLLSAFKFVVEVLPHRIPSSGGDGDVFAECADAPFGVPGYYTIDHTRDYGQFVELEGRRVFVDWREDKHTKEREALALRLHENRALLERRLKEFKAAHEHFRDDTISCLGLHERKPSGKVEVFWENSESVSLIHMRRDDFVFEE